MQTNTSSSNSTSVLEYTVFGDRGGADAAWIKLQSAMSEYLSGRHITPQTMKESRDEADKFRERENDAASFPHETGQLLHQQSTSLVDGLSSNMMERVSGTLYHFADKDTSLLAEKLTWWPYTKKNGRHQAFSEANTEYVFLEP